MDWQERLKSQRKKTKNIADSLAHLKKYLADAIPLLDKNIMDHQRANEKNIRKRVKSAEGKMMERLNAAVRAIETRLGVEEYKNPLPYVCPDAEPSYHYKNFAVGHKVWSYMQED